jgi:hypothetical protein
MIFRLSDSGESDGCRPFEAVRVSDFPESVALWERHDTADLCGPWFPFRIVSVNSER